MSTRPRSAAPSGRDAAFRAVLAVFRGEEFADESIRRRDARLDPRETGLALDVARGAIRHHVTIESVLTRLARYEPRRVSAPLRAVLHVAVYQLIWLDRVPEFAVVDAAVDQAKRYVGKRSAGMVNAILRNVTRAIAERRTTWQRLSASHVRVSWNAACEFREPVLPNPTAKGGAAEHLAAATGERPDAYRALIERFGEEQAEAIAWARQAKPATVLHANPLRITADEFAQRVCDQWPDEAEVEGSTAFLPSGTNPARAAFWVEGAAYVQDVTAQQAATLLGVQPGQRVLDLCAAPGGKSIALALAMQDRGEIVACDVSPMRLQRVQENAARLGLTCIRPREIVSAHEHGPPIDPQPFDAAIVDAPCSNTGVFARRPEARLGFTPRKLASLVALQAELLKRAARHVRPGGRLVYSTCSIEPEENEHIVEVFVKSDPAWEHIESHTQLPAWGLRLADWRDGGFAALLARS